MADRAITTDRPRTKWAKRVFNFVGYAGIAYLVGKMALAAAAHQWERGFEYQGWEFIGLGGILAVSFALKALLAVGGEAA